MKKLITITIMVLCGSLIYNYINFSNLSKLDWIVSQKCPDIHVKNANSETVDQIYDMDSDSIQIIVDSSWVKLSESKSINCVSDALAIPMNVLKKVETDIIPFDKIVWNEYGDASFNGNYDIVEDDYENGYWSNADIFDGSGKEFDNNGPITIYTNKNGIKFKIMSHRLYGKWWHPSDYYLSIDKITN